MSNIFQVVVVNYPVLRIRPPKVCEISPALAGAVYNFVGLEAHDIEKSLRSGELWDNAAAGKVLASVSEKAAAKA